MSVAAVTETDLVRLAPVGSTWYAWGHHVEIVEHLTRDGEPAVRERVIATGDELIPVVARLFLRRAAETDPSIYERSGQQLAAAPPPPNPPEGGGGGGASGQPAADTTEGESTMPTKTRPKTGPKERQARQQREAKAAQEPTAPEQAKGADLYQAVAAAAREHGEVVEHEKGHYARVRVDERTVAYIVPGKKGLRVYPQALAGDLPGIQFDKCDLGAHHYGKGEAIVPVKDEAAVQNAAAAIAAAAALPPRERKNAKA